MDEKAVKSCENGVKTDPQQLFHGHSRGFHPFHSL
jgi:hypothetical protein